MTALDCSKVQSGWAKYDRDYFGFPPVLLRMEQVAREIRPTSVSC